MNDRTKKWDFRYLALAAHVAFNWSKDPDKKVGAVITDDRYVVGIGYNGLPRGIQDSPDRLKHKDTKLDLTIHAEENALLSSGNRGTTIYVFPCIPCGRCLAKINQTSITRIVSLTQCLSEGSSWRPDLILELAKEMGIEVTLYSDFYLYLARPGYSGLN